MCVVYVLYVSVLYTRFMYSFTCEGFDEEKDQYHAGGRSDPAGGQLRRRTLHEPFRRHNHADSGRY